MKMTQICTGQWSTESGKINTAVYGLGEDGIVYKFVSTRNRWEGLTEHAVQDVSHQKQSRPQRSYDEPPEGITDDDVPF